MAEFTSVALQTIPVAQNVLLTETPVCGNCSVIHREGSGIVTLRGIATNQCRARYKVSFGGNVAVPAGGTVGAISLAISVNGETLPSTSMIVTPAAVSEFFNVFSAAYVDVPKGCCLAVSVRNTSDQSIDVQNANLIVERVA